MSPRQPTPEDAESATENPAANRPGERERDEERDDRGVVYHGADWDRAEEESERGALDQPAAQESDVDDDEVTEPGGGRGAKP
jgi:hypothetical protein